MSHVIPGLPKLIPGLELANTFGVKIRPENKKSLVCYTDSFLKLNPHLMHCLF
jgi:hypothetical protein